MALVRTFCLLAFTLGAAAYASSSLAYDWLQFNGDAAHGGNNTREKKISRNNVASLTQLFQAALPATTDGAPVVLRNAQTAAGLQDLLFVKANTTGMVKR